MAEVGVYLKSACLQCGNSDGELMMEETNHQAIYCNEECQIAHQTTALVGATMKDVPLGLKKWIAIFLNSNVADMDALAKTDISLQRAIEDPRFWQWALKLRKGYNSIDALRARGMGDAKWLLIAQEAAKRVFFPQPEFPDRIIHEHETTAYFRLDKKIRLNDLTMTIDNSDWLAGLNSIMLMLPPRGLRESECLALYDSIRAIAVDYGYDGTDFGHVTYSKQCRIKVTLYRRPTKRTSQSDAELAMMIAYELLRAGYYYVDKTVGVHEETQQKVVRSRPVRSIIK